MFAKHLFRRQQGAKRSKGGEQQGKTKRAGWREGGREGITLTASILSLTKWMWHVRSLLLGSFLSRLLGEGPARSTPAPTHVFQPGQSSRRGLERYITTHKHVNSPFDRPGCLNEKPLSVQPDESSKSDSRSGRHAMFFSRGDRHMTRHKHGPAPPKKNIFAASLPKRLQTQQANSIFLLLSSYSALTRPVRHWRVVSDICTLCSTPAMHPHPFLPLLSIYSITTNFLAGDPLQARNTGQTPGLTTP